MDGTSQGTQIQNTIGSHHLASLATALSSLLQVCVAFGCPRGCSTDEICSECSSTTLILSLTPGIGLHMPPLSQSFSRTPRQPAPRGGTNGIPLLKMA